MPSIFIYAALLISGAEIEPEITAAGLDAFLDGPNAHLPDSHQS